MRSAVPAPAAGLLINFGAIKLYVKNYLMTQERSPQEAQGGTKKELVIFVIFRVFCGQHELRPGRR